MFAFMIPILMAGAALLMAVSLWLSLFSTVFALLYDWFGLIYIEKIVMVWWPVLLLLVVSTFIYQKCLHPWTIAYSSRLAAGVSVCFYSFMLLIYTPSILMHGFTLFAYTVLASHDISVLGFISSSAFLGAMIFLFVYWLLGAIAAVKGVFSPEVYSAS